VADVVKKAFGVTYNPDHLGWILHDLGFTVQIPCRKDSRRDEAEIKHWREKEWLRIKKGRRRKQALFS
jgi:transposase